MDSMLVFLPLDLFSHLGLLLDQMRSESKITEISKL